MQFASRWWSILKEALLTVLAAVLAVLIHGKTLSRRPATRRSSAPVQIRGLDFSSSGNGHFR